MTSVIKVIIIEDEILARERLKRLLSSISNVEILAECSNGVEGLDAILLHQPDLIFLDIEMPRMNGLEMMAQLVNKPKVIFTTAFDQYAVDAFELNAVDYLLKPFTEDRLKESIRRVLNQRNRVSESTIEQIAAQLNLRLKSLHNNEITVKQGDKILLLPVHEICAFIASDKYVEVYHISTKYIINQSLIQIQDLLDEAFVKISRSAIVNRKEIREIRKGLGRNLLFYMKFGSELKIESGKTYQSEIRERFKI